MSDTFSLLKDLQNELKTKFANSLFATPEQAKEQEHKFVAPTVNIGHLPPKNKLGSKDKPPFIIVRPWEGEHGKKNETAAKVHEVKIGILCAVYSDEDSEQTEVGYNYIMNMMEGVMLVLFNRRYWANNFFAIKEPISWKLGLQKELGVYEAGLQEHPFYGAAVIAAFESKSLEFTQWRNDHE